MQAIDTLYIGLDQVHEHDQIIIVLDVTINCSIPPQAFNVSINEVTELKCICY